MRLVFARMIRRVPSVERDVRLDKPPPRVGKVYQRKLPGLSGRPNIRITAPPRRQRIGDVTHRHVIQEGYEGRRALQKWRLQWVRCFDKGWIRRHPTASDAEILERWRTRHRDRYCWVLEFDLLDPVRCMADQRDILSGRTQHGVQSTESDQYVASGGIDPYAEAVDPAVVGQLQARMQQPSRKARRQARGRRLFG
jgi:hypothetical protein